MTDHPPIPNSENKDEPVAQAEQFILDIFHQEPTQERLRSQMQQVVRTELGKMSELLKDAIGDWVAKEKSKHDPQIDRQKTILLEEKVENFEINNRRLTDENSKLIRTTKLRAIENRIIIEGLRRLQGDKSKP